MVSQQIRSISDPGAIIGREMQTEINSFSDYIFVPFVLLWSNLAKVI